MTAHGYGHHGAFGGESACRGSQCVGGRTQRNKMCLTASVAALRQVGGGCPIVDRDARRWQCRSRRIHHLHQQRTAKLLRARSKGKNERQKSGYCQALGELNKG